MGEIASMMIDGTLCEGCGEYLGKAVGHPRYCFSCKPRPEDPGAINMNHIKDPKETTPDGENLPEGADAPGTDKSEEGEGDPELEGTGALVD